MSVERDRDHHRRGFVIGGGIGLYMARTVAMTAMPQLVSLFNAVGGGAAALVAIDDYVRIVGRGRRCRSRPAIFVVLGAVIGGVTFSGSLIAVGQAAGHRPAASRSSSPARASSRR